MLVVVWELKMRPASDSQLDRPSQTIKINSALHIISCGIHWSQVVYFPISFQLRHVSYITDTTRWITIGRILRSTIIICLLIHWRWPMHVPYILSIPKIDFKILPTAWLLTSCYPTVNPLMDPGKEATHQWGPGKDLYLWGHCGMIVCLEHLATIQLVGDCGVPQWPTKWQARFEICLLPDVKYCFPL